MRFRMPKYARDMDTPDGTTPPSPEEPAG